MNFGEKLIMPSAETPEDDDKKTEEKKPTLGQKIKNLTRTLLEGQQGLHARRLNEEADRNKLEKLRQDIEKK